MRNGWKMRASLAALIIWCSTTLPTPAPLAAEGATIWGDDRISTVRAMKAVMRALGVKTCLHCHVKASGKVDYEADTEHKQFARLMKFAFVDSLMARGQGEVVLKEDDNTTQIVAQYRPEGENAGIFLKVVVQPTAEGSPSKTFERQIELPKDGPVDCVTCHAGELHFLTQEKEEG